MPTVPHNPAEVKQKCVGACGQVATLDSLLVFSGYRALLAVTRTGDTRPCRVAWKKTAVDLQARIGCLMYGKAWNWGKPRSGIQIPQVEAAPPNSEPPEWILGQECHAPTSNAPTGYKFTSLAAAVEDSSTLDMAV